MGIASTYPKIWKRGNMSKSKFVGTWKLVSLEVHLSDGTVMKPYGDNPIGMGMFDGNNFIGQLMKPNRKEFEAGNQFGGTSEEIKEAFEGILHILVAMKLRMIRPL